MISLVGRDWAEWLSYPLPNAILRDRDKDGARLQYRRFRILFNLLFAFLSTIKL